MHEIKWTMEKVGLGGLGFYPIDPGHISMPICHDIFPQQFFVSTRSGTKADKF